MLANRLIQIIRIIVLGVLFNVLVVEACDPLPVLLYSPGDVYQREGWKIPDLPEGTVAVMNGELIDEADFKAFIYEKVGFDPLKRELFMTNLLLKRELEQKGIDTAFQKTLIEEHFPTMEVGALYHSCSGWKTAPAREGMRARADFYAKTVRIEKTYLKALYILDNWDVVYELGPNDFGIDRNVFDVEGEDEAIKNVVRLNNALVIENMFSALISDHIRETTLVEADMNFPDDRVEFKKWAYKTYTTVYLLETYLGMLLSKTYAVEHEIEIASATVQEEKLFREGAYKQKLDAFNQTLPDGCVPLNFSPIYADFIMSEIVDDLTKSRASRIETAVHDHEILLRYYKAYGFDGVRCDAREIYRWVRKRRQKVPGYKEYVESKRARVQEQMKSLRDTILNEGPESFYRYAMMENDSASRQALAGRIDVREGYGEEIAGTLSEMNVGEISPIMSASRYTLDFFMYAGMEGTNRVVYGISKAVPPRSGFDYISYHKQCDEVIEQLEQLKIDLENGASIEPLAEKYSDNYDWDQGNLSDAYQDKYGFTFAQKMNAIPDGGCEVLRSEDGFHLVQILSRVHTPMTDDIKANIIREYYDELAPQDERYELAKKWLFTVNPYFK